MSNIHIEILKYEDNEPCKHRGCKHHVTHPCETCGRVKAKGSVTITINRFNFLNENNP